MATKTKSKASTKRKAAPRKAKEPASSGIGVAAPQAPTGEAAKAAQKVANQGLPAPKKGQVQVHPFAPGQKVSVYHELDVQVQRHEDREPGLKPETTATVSDDGSLQFSGLKKGFYVAHAPNPQEVKEDDAARRLTQNHSFVSFNVK